MTTRESDPTDMLPSADVQSRVFLQPIAAPSILGLYGLAGATFMVAAQMAHWFGPSIPGNSTFSTTMLLVPFAALFGGLAQFLAGMWAYKARDGVATAVHGTWGGFWMAFGILALLVVTGRVPLPASLMVPEMGYWFIVLAAITWACTAAAVAENKAMVTVLTFLAAGSTISAIALLAGIDDLMVVAAYLFIICAIAAWYTASALMINEAFGRSVWSLGTSTSVRRTRSVSVGMGEPGVIHGQA